MTLALYYDDLFPGHDTLSHPEHPSRVTTAIDLLQHSPFWDQLETPACRDATEEELTRVHTADHVRRVSRFGQQGPVMVLADTIANTGTYAAALRAAGAVVGATEAVTRGDFESAYCLVRPPGHHAVAGAPMGFCFFNNVAVAARHATDALGVQRLAIVDIDIHHGNGTQDAFYEDGRVLYISTHQWPFYPGTGHWRETGRGHGLDSTLNLPLPGGCGDIEYGYSMDQVVLPRLRQYRPQLLLVSAGYDAHYGDPIDGAMMRLSSAGYGGLVASLKAFADETCDGRIIVALEGGYDLTALSWSIRNSVEALLGRPATQDPLGPVPQTKAPDIGELVTNVRRLHGLE